MILRGTHSVMRKTLLFSVSMALLLLAACSSQNGDVNEITAADFLPATIAEGDVTRSSEVRIFADTLLWEYINGGAELYHQYGFAEVATADYRRGQTEVVADIYRFETPEGAYGLYTAMRPDHPAVVPFGIEGFKSGSSMDYVKGSFLVRLVGYDQSPETTSLIDVIAGAINDTIPGKTDRPVTFGSFPDENAIGFTDRIVAQSYLGQASLTDVYCQDYLLDDDTLTLFLTDDMTGDKFLRWSEKEERDEASGKIAGDFPFDDSHAMLASNSYYGNILVGLKEGRLIGVVNYSDRHRQFVISWLESL